MFGGPRFGERLVVAAIVLLPLAAVSVTACGGGGTDEPLSAQDSVATAKEIDASLSGRGGEQTYTYRGVYAGMSRSALEQRAPMESASVAPSCDREPSRADPGTPRRCEFDALFRSDSASAHVEVSYMQERRGETVGEVTVTRDLPLDVDGLRLARAIASAFERQTSVLDHREESFTPRAAHIRVGATSGARQNFAEVTVEERRGRQRLIVRLSRAAQVTKGR